MNALWMRLTVWMEYVIVTHLVPRRVGPIMRIIFKSPLLFYHLGLGKLLANRILVLVTRGRRTGLQRLTPLEYSYYPESRQYLLMSGWGGKSDWYLNACAWPEVEIWLGNQRLPGLAQPAKNEDVVRVMEDALKIYPKAVKTWSGYSGEVYDGTRESLARMARAFPSMFVTVSEQRPIRENKDVRR